MSVSERGRTSALTAAGAAVLLLAAAARGGAPVELPQPDLTGMEGPVQEQLATTRGAVETLLAAGEAGDTEIATALGELAQLYLLHELTAAAETCFAAAAARAPEDYRWPYFRGYIQQARGELEAAAASFRRALELASGDGPSLLRLGQVELARGRLEAAEAALERALTDPQMQAAAHFELGRAADARGDLPAAAGHFEAALELEPQASKVRYPLALVYRRLGDLEAARRQLEMRGEAAVTFADPLLARLADASRGASLHLINAARAKAAGRLDDAVAEYRRALAKAPDDARAHQGLGEALARSGRVKEAISHYRRAAELEPGSAVAHYDLGTLLLQQGRLEEAEAALEAALDRAPDFEEALANLAAVHGRSGRMAEAAATLEKLLELDPDDAQARRRYAFALRRLGRDEDAARALEAVVAAAPEDALARLQLAQLRARAGRSEEALEELEAAAGSAGGEPALAGRIDLERGSLLAALGRWPQAADAFARAARELPREPTAHLGYAQALLAAGRCGAAQDALGRGLSQRPDSGEMVHLLARLLATCPEADRRDGRRALELALRVHGALPSFQHTETVAMAWAELGRFEDAVSWQLRAVATGEASAAAAGELAAARARLEGYRRGEPCRAPWLATGDGTAQP